MRTRFSRWPSALPLALALPAAAWAQGAAAPAQLPAIIVTADKTPQALEQTPASVAVLDALDVQAENLHSLAQLEGRAPGLSFQPFGQAGLNAPVLRGLTANFNSFATSALLLVDGVPTPTAQGFEDALLDVARIEVLRGPQSTLYGANAQAGVIAIHSQPIDGTPRTRVAAELGSRNLQRAQFALSRPVVEGQLYTSIAASAMRQQGFIRNQHTGGRDDARQNSQLKLGLRWTPTAHTEAVLRYARQDYDDGANRWGSPRQPRAQVASGTPGWNRSKGQSLSLHATHEGGAGLRWHAITAWSRFSDHTQQDTDFGPADALHVGRDNRLRTLSQELRLEGQLGQAQWLGGLYLAQDRHRLHYRSQRMGQLDQPRSLMDKRTLAWFTHWSLPLSERWSLAAGARIEQQRARITPQGQAARRQSWRHLSPKLALQYQLRPQQQWYASVSRGVRSGGFNALSVATDHAPFAPETSWSYETGFKGWALDKRLRYTLALYHMRIGDMQVMQMPRPGFMYLTNAASARSQGLEWDLDYLLGGGWQFKAGLAANRTRFARFVDGAADYSGKRNPFAPRLSGHASLRYDAPQGWYAQAGLTGSSKVYLDAANRHQRRGHALLNLAAGYQRRPWEISAHVRNAGNTAYDAVGYQNGFVTVYSPPREIGLRLSWQY
ncbi:TonB-dependent receptor [Allofranklinella schreckenbergeri]|uniref:TonB-dependent receptor n=1 Tax=Allofranklinella schreckenbergeri TaxID=1076744 RepID=A0A3M6Q712_9BURK|nr:TonB-dependent receptor [Allofranklinella schreckenbergeri]RMW98766.1 TonB-dependent receptor [Allofranklinella schreckenbergeri]